MLLLLLISGFVMVATIAITGIVSLVVEYLFTDQFEERVNR